VSLYIKPCGLSLHSADYQSDIIMDLAMLSAELSTQHYLHIVKSKSDRQHNRALLLDTHTDQLSPNCVPAMIPSAYFHDDKPRLVFDCHIHEARSKWLSCWSHLPCVRETNLIRIVYR